MHCFTFMVWVKEYWKINQSDNEALLFSANNFRIFFREKDWDFLVLVTLVVRLIKCMLILLFIHYRRATLNYMHLVAMIYLLIIFRRVEGRTWISASFNARRDNLLKSFFLFFISARSGASSYHKRRGKRRMIYENLLRVEKEWKTTQNITEGLMRRFWLSLLWSFDCFPL
jgi:hypothetical protein